MEKQDSKYIEHIEIKGLWGRYDGNWKKLNSDVNILVGENGTGKSTILKALERVKIVISDRKNTSLNVELDNDNYINTLTIFLNNRKNNKSIILHQGRFFNHKQNVSVGGHDIDLLPKIDYIRTFDSTLNVSDIDRKFNSELETELDFQLKKIIENYLNYQLDLSKKIINKKQNAELVFAKRRYFIETVNRLFEKTEKVIDEEENGISLLLTDKTVIKPYDLSSGEKQLLIILLTVLCQDEKPSILLMDEPEISLHLRWQYELIEILRTLNPNCQLIIATHSPSIFNHGWRDKVFWIEDIVKEKEAVHE